MSTKDAHIRTACPSDLPAVNRILDEVRAVHHALRPDLFRPAGKKYTDDELLVLFACPETPVFVYEDGGAVLGYIFCAVQETGTESGSGALQSVKTLYIDDLCVEASARGQGIGTRLFHFAEDYARSLGCHNLTLHLWEGNPAAAFYAAQGLRPQYTALELVLDA